MIVVKKIRIPTLPTKEPRRLYVYLPKDYRKSERRYPVLYMFDGHNVFYDSHATFGKSWGMKEYLEKSKAPLIVVAVECNHEGNRRLSEYTPWNFRFPTVGFVPTQGKLTMDWITGSLKPMIDAAYRTLPDRDHTFIAGSSMGGLMSIYAAVQYNSVFSRAAALSPSLWVSRKGVRELIRSSSLAKPTQIYMDCGSLERKEFPMNMDVLFWTAKLLTEAGAYVDVRDVPDATHCEAAWEKRIPVFFEYLFSEIWTEKRV